MGFNYERERDKLYNVLYGREPDEELEQLDDNHLDQNMTETASMIAGMLPFLLVVGVLLYTINYLWFSPSRFLDWFARGGVELKRLD